MTAPNSQPAKQLGQYARQANMALRRGAVRGLSGNKTSHSSFESFVISLYQEPISAPPGSLNGYWVTS